MTEEQARIKLFIVDDHLMVREGLRAFLQLASDIEIVGEAATGEEAVAGAAELCPDVILMDLVMPGALDGVEATRTIVRRQPRVRVIALTSFQEPERMTGILEAGAISYLQKDVNPQDLLGAVRQAAAGRTVLEAAALRAIRGLPSPSAESAAVRHSRTLIDPLTAREQDVLERLANGLSNKEIAAVLGIAEKTVKVHVSHILGKLGVYDRTQALLAASRLGLIHIR